MGGGYIWMCGGVGEKRRGEERKGRERVGGEEDSREKIGSKAAS